MKRPLICALAILGLYALPAWAGDDVKTLPPAMYDQMKSGKKLDKVWVDPAYDKSKGVKTASLAYKAELRVGEVMDSLKKGFSTLITDDSPYTLKVTVVQVSTKTFTGLGNVMGAVTVEGQIVDASGKVLAAFMTKARAGGFGSGKDDYPAACDKITSAIAKDLL